MASESNELAPYAYVSRETWEYRMYVLRTLHTKGGNMITIRNMTLGSGRPKICVPLVSGTVEALQQECTSLGDCPLDMLEWRVDYLLKR